MLSVIELERIVDKALYRYRHHREFEDLRQEGLVGAWQELTTAAGRAAPSRLAWDGARWAVAKYFRSRRCHPNDYHRTDTKNTVAWVEYAEDTPWDQEPDFAPPLIAQFWGRQVAADLKRSCSARQWQMIDLSILQGLQTKGAARALGIAPCSVKTTVARALRNYRCSLSPMED